MKKTVLLLFAVSLLLTTLTYATDYLVSGAGTTAINGTYSPDGTNLFGAPRWKLSGGSYYLHSDGGGMWVINDNGDVPFDGYYVNISQSPFNQNIPPFTGWMGEMGSPPAPTIGEAGPSLSYSTGTFSEFSADDGSIDNSTPVIITHNNFGGGTFTGTNGDNFVTDGKIIVSNLPVGLTAVITRTSSTTLSVTITGIAPSHNNANDVLNLTFAFQDAAFSTGDASAISNSAKNDLIVNFIQEYYVAKSGGDFTTIAAAIAASGNGDVINVSAETFTEVELIVDKNLTIRGQGADVTIIQADVTPNTAAHRVFNISSKIIATIENVTIRHGKASSEGGGIANYGTLTLQNAAISYNNCPSQGGGIYHAGQNMSINNCLINNNTVNSDYAQGGGVLISGGVNATITNSTITANTSISTSQYYGRGGGIVQSSGSTLSLINCTITNNTVSSVGGGFWTNDGYLTISNTIIADNGSSDYYVVWISLTDNGNNIIKNQAMSNGTNWKFSSATDILYNYKADGTASTSWNRNNAALVNQNLNISLNLEDNNTLNGTQTLALLSGSFAIDAGTDAGAPTTDQRGFYRNGTTDIGAFEYDGIPFTGAGTEGSPYEISNLDELTVLSQNSSYWAAGFYFIQTANINALPTSGWDGGAGWSPIGNTTTYFSGSYDGQGHTIDGLFINRSGEDYQGLFGAITTVTAKIKNLGVTNVNITGYDKVGGLVGYNYNSSEISNCYATGSVSGNNIVSGLVGYNYNAAVGKCYSNCSVNGNNQVGGLVGYNRTLSISNCYSTGSVSGVSVVGGLVGLNRSGAVVSNSYSIGLVTGTSTPLGGLVGNNESTVNNSFWDIQTSGQAASSGGTGKTTAEMKMQSTFYNAGWDVGTWSIDSEINSGYPYLDWQNPGGTPLPVELSTFTATAIGSTVTLNWQTATEINNYGFEIEKKEVSEQKTIISNQYLKIGFIEGYGNSNSPKNYSYTDENLSNGKYLYRLKQLDNDGNFSYSVGIEVEVNQLPTEFALYQNYPNPFNPSTTIKFGLPTDSKVVLEIYSIIGEKVATLLNNEMAAGIFEINYNGGNLSSGVYFLTINAKSLNENKNFRQTKKMILMK
ncbi:MAG: choice-of-anchor Q domain-containing protein [bacterium]